MFAAALFLLWLLFSEVDQQSKLGGCDWIQQEDFVI